MKKEELSKWQCCYHSQDRTNRLKMEVIMISTQRMLMLFMLLAEKQYKLHSISTSSSEPIMLKRNQSTLLLRVKSDLSSQTQKPGNGQNHLPLQ